MADLLIGIFAVAGAALMLIAGLGVMRFRDLYTRIHAATKAPTLATVLISIAGALALDQGRGKIILAVIVIFITTPAAAHFIGRAAYRAGGIDVQVDGDDDLGVLDAPGPSYGGAGQPDPG